MQKTDSVTLEAESRASEGRTVALSAVAYALPIIGPVAVLLIEESGSLARHHAKQALGLNVAVVGSTVVWAVVAWVLAWIPLVGPIVSASLFSLVILTYLGALALWVAGLVGALRGQTVQLPLISALSRRLFSPPPPP